MSSPAQGPDRKIRDDAGNEIDATFFIDQDTESMSIVFKSGGAGKYNLQYDRGLALLLMRLAAHSATITRVMVDSTTAKTLSPAEASRTLPSFAQPRLLTPGEDIESLRTTMQREQRPIAQVPGAKGGSSQKRVRIRVSVPGAATPEALERVLLGKKSLAEKARDAIERLPSPPPLPPPGAQGAQFDPSKRDDARAVVWAQVKERQGQGTFRKELLASYGGRCAITGCDAEEALEAAHIQPYLGAHTNHIENGLLLRADLHTLFDRGLLTIDSSSWTIVLAPWLREGSYAELHGAAVRAMCGGGRPNGQAVDEHRKECGF